MAEHLVDRDRPTWAVFHGDVAEDCPADVDGGPDYVALVLHDRVNLVLSPHGAKRLAEALATAARKAAGEIRPEDARCACCGKVWVDVENGFDTCESCRARQ